MQEVVVQATPDDLSEIMGMLLQMHKELEPMGGEVRQGERTVEYVRKLVTMAINGHGACLVVRGNDEIAACTVVTEIEYPYDHASGRIGFGMGTYVRPAYRGNHLADLLYGSMRRHLKANGFNNYRGGYLVANKQIQPILAKNHSRDMEVIMNFPLEGD